MFVQAMKNPSFQRDETFLEERLVELNIQKREGAMNVFEEKQNIDIAIGAIVFCLRKAS